MLYEARYWGILSAYTILHVQAGFIHVICLGISNKSVAVYPDRTAFALYLSAFILASCNLALTVTTHSLEDFKDALLWLEF